MFSKGKIKQLCTIGMLSWGVLHANTSYSYQSDLLSLSSENVSIAVSPKAGGELASIEVKHLNKWHELLYKGKDYIPKKGWRGKAPLLWPATGATTLDGLSKKGVKSGKYKVNKHIYSMPFHGFAQNLHWRLLNKNHNSIALSIEDTAETQKQFPFGFKVDVKYELRDRQLLIQYNIFAKAANTSSMPFSIGNHITFNAPLLNTSSINDFKFSTPCQQRVERNSHGFPTGNLTSNQLIGIKSMKDLPERKSISLTDCGDDKKVTLLDSSGLNVDISHFATHWPKQPVIEYNMWASKAFGFISPEPWVGAQNSLNSRYGLIELLPGEQWQWSIKIDINEN